MEKNSERIITPMPPSLVRAIDDFRYEQHIPSRSEAVRRLIGMGLEAAGKPPRKAGRAAKP
jgi:metal-responsive CopG/Arc/MetJ family transcriptional regulator